MPASSLASCFGTVGVTSSSTHGFSSWWPNTSGARWSTSWNGVCPSWSPGVASPLSDDVLERAVQHLVDVQGIEVISRSAYEQFEEAARRRVPRDPNDWAPIALAMVLDAGILTGDYDFLGCGCPTWTVETLRAELGES